MIILKQLAVERFRLLREINLHFPERGSILIQGPNEAGKSTLFESIYFALFGEAIVRERVTSPVDSLKQELVGLSNGRSSLDDLICYGEASAVVTLVLVNEGHELVITRTIERGKGQQVTVRVRKQGMGDEEATLPTASAKEAATAAFGGRNMEATLPTASAKEAATAAFGGRNMEVISDLGRANQRILAEFGAIDGDALRDSCFVEQKGLDRLEHLNAAQRQETLRKLLGLKKLASLADEFTLTPADEYALHESNERARLAEIQDRIPALSEKLSQIESSLDALAIAADLEEMRRLEREITEQEQLLTHLRAKRSELKARQARIQQLKRAEKTFEEIIVAYEAIAEAQRELPELEREISELDRRERSELPGLEQRVNDVVDLTHSFSTLERMSNDLLACVSTIKELERELKHRQAWQEQGSSLDEQIIRSRLELDQARHHLNEVESRLQAERPQLQARMKRLRRLAERTITLYLAEEQFAQRLKQQRQAQDNRMQAAKAQEELQEERLQQSAVELQEQQLQQQVNGLQQQWNRHQLGRHLEEWQRLKKLSQELADAEQQVKAAHQRQEQLNSALLSARRKTMYWLMGGVAGVVLALVVVILLLALRPGAPGAHPALSVVFLLLVLLLLAGAGYCFYRYTLADKEKKAADSEAQVAINQVSSMVAVREAAARIGDNRQALALCEQEIHAAGGTVPNTRVGAGLAPALASLVRGMPLAYQDVVGIEERLAAARAAVDIAHQQTEAARARVEACVSAINMLDEEYKSQRWDEIEAKLRADKDSMKQKQQEIASLAGQEGLPIPNLDTSITQPIVSNAQLEQLVTEAIAGTDREITVLESQFGNTNELTSQLKTLQDALDVLVAQRQAVAEEEERYKSRDLARQLKQAQEQQHTLSDALQLLQDSLRQRVKQLEIAFGQTAINKAEASARKRLEALNMSLNRRVELQSRRAYYQRVLKERQEALADHYHQLAKMSATLGNWIVPLNPFADSLIALRARCQREIREANENNMMQELAGIDLQEGAVTASVQLYHEEIERAQEQVTFLLEQHHRLLPVRSTHQEIIAAWPLIAANAVQDRSALEDERRQLEQELRQLERQEYGLSTRLQTGGEKLDLERERTGMQQQQRNYSSKKYGPQLLKAVDAQVMQKMLPRIEYYIQRIVPLLSQGRYHEVQLGWREDGNPDISSEEAFQMRVWDSAAHAYIAKDRLSGGSADQLALALRLAFVIAALPREASSAPSFLFLDEPLSSFDRERTQALVDALKSEVIDQHFEQVLFISHLSVFDTALFPYTVYMEAGRVIESNLPDLPALPKTPETLMPAEGNGEVEAEVSTPASVAVES